MECVKDKINNNKLDTNATEKQYKNGKLTNVKMNIQTSITERKI